MSSQYHLLSTMHKLLTAAVFNSTWVARVECLIYRLKLILLTWERRGVIETEKLCPSFEIERLNRLLQQATTVAEKEAAVREIEVELKRIIALAEPGPAPAEVGAEQFAGGMTA